MFLLYTLQDRILLKPDDLNMKNKEASLLYEEIILEKAREKYIGKVLINHGIAITIKRLMIINNLIVETEGVISIEVKIILTSKVRS
jgi:DNA-directed RNA polymerase subunit E'/Rpb7